MTNLSNLSPASPLTAVVVSADPMVVISAQAAMRLHAEVWNVLSVDSEERAIDLLNKLERVDIFIVYGDGSGMAATVLERVRYFAPHTVRIALSDRANAAVMPQLAAIAHQILPMPLDAEVLGDLVGRMRSVTRSELCDPVRTLVGQAERLPSPPKMFQRLNEMLATDDWRVEDLAAEIETDAALTSELLKLVNSSFYGSGSRVRSVTRAISLIGIKLTRFIVLGNQLFVSSGGFDTWIDLERVATRSNAVARGARALAAREQASDDVVSSAYLSGLVSEIGLLVLARIPDIEPSIAAPVNSSVFLGAERVLFGGDRFEVGAELLALWGFDQDVVDAVARLSSEEPSQPGELAWFLSSARQLIMEHGVDPDELGHPPRWDAEIDVLIDACRTGAQDAVPAV
ncbi:MAG: HDOD domain-containing protein [Ilumatobacter sp.]